MKSQDEKAGALGGVAIVAIVAVFVLVLGTVMLFAQEDTAPQSDLARDAKEPAESFEFEVKSEEGSVSIQSEES